MSEVQAIPPKPIPSPRRGLPVWVWVLIAFAALFALACGGCVVGVLYLGFVAPDTSVYAGAQVPSRFVKVMKEVGAIEPNERLLFFYSDALVDIRDGFYFVSDQRVVIYAADQAQPLTTVSFGEIADVELERDTSFITDSTVTLELHDGQVFWFPVSSEYDRDVLFFEAIEGRVDTR